MEKIYINNNKVLSSEMWLEYLINDITPHHLELLLNICSFENFECSQTQYIKKFNYNPNSSFHSSKLSLAQRVYQKHKTLEGIVEKRNDGTYRWWSVCFLGYYINQNKKKYFIWKVRDELVNALYVYVYSVIKINNLEVNEIEKDELFLEGNCRLVSSYKYERSTKGVEKFKKFSNNTCQICAIKTIHASGVDFGEAHHRFPIAKKASQGAYNLNIKTDFFLLCSNCHTIIHKHYNIYKDPKILSDLDFIKETLGIF